ncbi:MAG: hypothetical protein CML13_14695 [Puniceicoccaceae bacterium]|nr:hypothetical protein [Puniceicoccaceae bacterium]|tara:strand:- start:27341 stop:28528 length:1188 start_codon:yes stop_codon:yes gene_type:complete
MKSDYEQSATLIRNSFKRLFVTLMEQTADRIYIKDTQSRFVFVSEALARTHGLQRPTDIEGMTDFDFYDQATAQGFFDEEQRIMRTNEPLINRIEKESWKSGNVTWVSHSKTPLRLDTGETIGLIGISRDVTEEHCSKQQVLEQNKTMRADIASAQKVQQIMIPGRLPVVDDIRIAYVWQPMTSVGGDIISFPRSPGKELIFFMADVCGHGVQAALYTVLLKYMSAHAAEEYDKAPDHFLNTINEHVIGRITQGFVTAVAGHFDPPQANGSRKLHLSNAGQPDWMLLRASSQTVEHLKLASAMVMGLPTGQASPPVEYTLHAGDRLFLFTDGIVESAKPNGEEFGIEGLRQTIESYSNLPLQQCVDKTYQAALQHTGDLQLQDDMTLLAFEIASC